MRTPEQIARYAFSGADSNSLTVEIAKRIAAEAIEADRAQFFDTSGSASSQHYIDTGRYLLHEEVAEMEMLNFTVGQRVTLTGHSWQEFEMRGDTATISGREEGTGHPVFTRPDGTEFVIWRDRDEDYSAVPA